MGTWDTGPFDNDTAADFCGDLDEAAADEREGMIRSALTRVIDTENYLEAPESDVAVAAAALVAAQCPQGPATDSAHEPKEPLPDLAGLRDLALQALDCVMTEPSELLEIWDGTQGSAWRAEIHQLQNGLLPQPLGEQIRLV
ncbi:DUF4259 domain-containing protein [Streptomyces sp. NPDC051018]|uniref:DUF4259 domain-containing protein n=1 Tax=Streptomyces sp. NPDC051018 TaxID=3365639 RepID=UPI00378CD6F0